MPEQLFLFVQLELPWELGPADGRYLLRGREGGEAERVVVLSTVGAARRGRGVRRGRRLPTTPEPAPVPTARATVIDPVPLSAEHQARTWLAELDAERETRAAAATLNRVLFAHRIATADPCVHELSPAQALVIRAGWGEGEQVAYGRWLHARELPWSERRERRRAAVLRPQERIAVLLGARGRALICEELTLRARLDLEEGRLAHAALGLERAYAAALAELAVEHQAAVLERVEELRELYPGVIDAARIALPDAASTADPDEQLVSHALGRLEAALRARTALGFSVE